MDCFKRVGDTVGCPRLVRLVEVGDVDPEELVVGGEIADTPYGDQLKELKSFSSSWRQGVDRCPPNQLLKTEVSA